MWSSDEPLATPAGIRKGQNRWPELRFLLAREANDSPIGSISDDQCISNTCASSSSVESKEQRQGSEDREEEEEEEEELRRA